jgi:hypothetical protein
VDNSADPGGVLGPDGRDKTSRIVAGAGDTVLKSTLGSIATADVSGMPGLSKATAAAAGRTDYGTLSKTVFALAQPMSPAYPA